jgi:hypothetical protein
LIDASNYKMLTGCLFVQLQSSDHCSDGRIFGDRKRVMVVGKSGNRGRFGGRKKVQFDGDFGLMRGIAGIGGSDEEGQTSAG